MYLMAYWFAPKLPKVPYTKPGEYATGTITNKKLAPGAIYASWTNGSVIIGS